MDEKKNNQWVDLLTILQEQEVALFGISSEDVSVEKVGSLNQAKENNRKAQETLREIMENGNFELGSLSPVLTSSSSSPSPNYSPTFRSAPTSPSLPSLSLSFDPTSTERDKDNNREKEKKSKSLAQLFFSRSKSSLSLRQLAIDVEKEREKERDKDKEKEKDQDNQIEERDRNVSMTNRSPLGKKRLSLTSSFDTLRRRQKEKENKPKGPEEIDNYYKMYESSRMLFEKKRELLKTSGADVKISKEGEECKREDEE